MASSQQYWLHPESQRTRGFNTELRRSSSEGITRAVLREIDPQHIQSQGCPSRAHLQRTNTPTQTPGHNLFMSFTHKHTAHCLLTHTCALTQKQQHTIHEAVMMPHIESILLTGCTVQPCILPLSGPPSPVTNHLAQQ